MKGNWNRFLVRGNQRTIFAGVSLHQLECISAVAALQFHQDAFDFLFGDDRPETGDASSLTF